MVTEGGDLLGTIAHLEIDGDARKVTAYTLASSLLDRVMRHEDEAVKADEVLRLGERDHGCPRRGWGADSAREG